MAAAVPPPARTIPPPPPSEVRDGFDRQRVSSAFLPVQQAEVRVAAPAGGEVRARQDASLRDAISSATGPLNQFTPDVSQADTFQGPRVGTSREVGRGTGIELQGEARSRTTQRMSREGEQDVYRQTIDGRGVVGGRIAPRGRVGLAQENETTTAVAIEQRVPAGAQVPTNWAALNDPRTMPEGGELRIRGASTGKTQDGADLPVGAFGSVGVDRSSENGAGAEVRVRREGDFATVTRIDDQSRTTQGRLGASVGVLPRLGGVHAGELRGGSENVTRERSEQSARFNLGTAEGRAAYQQFTQTLQVPTVAAPGVDQIEQRESSQRQRATIGSAEAILPTSSDKLEGRSVTYQRDDQRVRRADGSEERVRRVGTPAVEGREREPRTEVVERTVNGVPSYEVQLHNPDPLTRQLIQRAAGQQPSRAAAIAETGDLTLRFTSAEFDRLRTRLNTGSQGIQLDSPPPGAQAQMDILAGKSPYEVATMLDRARMRSNEPTVSTVIRNSGP